MKLKDGNKYVITKPFTTEKGHTVTAGAICFYYAGNFYWGSQPDTWTCFRADQIPAEDITIYEETPYNKDWRERRERIATQVFCSMVNATMANTKTWEAWNNTAEIDGYLNLKEWLSNRAVVWAEELMRRLDEED